MLLLLREAVSDPHSAQIGHRRGHEACFFLQLAARKLFRIDIGRLPAALRQFKCALLNGVAKLLDEIDRFAINGEDHSAIILIDYTVDSLSSVVTLDLVLAKTKPGITVNLAAAQSADAHD